MNKGAIIRLTITTFVILIALVYGILIGKYQIFPYSLLKNLQDGTEVHLNNALKNIQYDEDALNSMVSVNLITKDSLRLELKHLIFGEQAVEASLQPDSIITIKDLVYQDLDNLSRLEKFYITQKHNIQSIGYIFHPQNSNHRLLLYHQGHDGGFVKGKATIAYFLAKGFTIYAFSMPLKGENNRPVIEVSKIGKIQLSNHEEFKFLEHPLQYFIAPVISMLNYAQKQNFKDINMVGVSGGGWTTTLVAALDERIQNSFPVAGSFPMFVRYQEQSNNYGDFEQTFPDLYTKINYLDLYLLGATGDKRSQLQISNKYDPCCYGGEAYKQYDEYLSKKVGEFESGHFNILSDSTHKEHKISQWALNEIAKSLSLLAE